MTLTNLLKGSALGALSISILFAAAPERAEAAVAGTPAAAMVEFRQDGEQPFRERVERGDSGELRQERREARQAAPAAPQTQRERPERVRQNRQLSRDAARSQVEIDNRREQFRRGDVGEAGSNRASPSVAARARAQQQADQQQLARQQEEAMNPVLGTTGRRDANRGDGRQDWRQDWRQDQRNERRDTNRRGGQDWRQDQHDSRRDTRQAYRAGERNTHRQARYHDGQRWNNYQRWDRQNWRNNQRYNWQGYRASNRSLFRPGRYYSPYNNHRYSRLSIGIGLGSVFFGSRYQIHDPWRYRLPAVYGPYRWVRYYDDVLLVDIYSGRVVDVIYDFFW